MKTVLLAVVIVAAVLTPIILIVRHLAKDDTAKLERSLRDERESWDRFKRVVDKDMDDLRSRGFSLRTKESEDR